ncbi:MAG: flagellar motor switch protein FliG [Candidatus Tectomicrobia bacterium]|uniref:Flagellar motor switch protein FliG n=1 Tax=Tectimicrobiota bacterium TaxID=2528274 RepID=A0A932CMB5_UNCTE|nr:flagellar motor switch protein FliG [Candidatus Tectomicrobia bacterium]
MVEGNKNLKDLSGSKKAAVFLLALGDEMAAKILAHLDDQEIRQITPHIANTANMPVGLVDAVLEEFEKSLTNPTTIHLGGKEVARKVLSRAMGEEKAEALMREMAPIMPLSPPFQSLKEVDPKIMANFLQAEHPQTMAIILSHLEPEQSSAVLKELPEELQVDRLIRMATMDRIAADVLHEIDEVMRNQIRVGGGSTYSGERKKGKTLAPVAKLLSYMEKSSVDNLMASLSERNPELANKISDLMFVFNDLALVDDRGIQSILREVSRDDLMMALKGANDEIKEIIFRNMSDRARQMLEEDLEVMGPVRLSDVERAQKAIVKVASRLESEGKIVVRRGWDEIVA